MLEQAIEDYLCEGVKTLGGEVRKAEWVGRRHCPDRRVMHPKRCCWVECKKPGEKVRPGQAREHDRMRALGEDVVVLSTYEEVDEFLETLKCARKITVGRRFRALKTASTRTSQPSA